MDSLYGGDIWKSSKLIIIVWSHHFCNHCAIHRVVVVIV